MTHSHVGPRAVLFGLGVLMCAAVFAVTERGAVAQPGPAAATAIASSTPGKNVFDAHCVECHGTTGKGDGPASMTLVPRPRDFTSGRYKIHSTETGSLPTDEDLLRTVRQGLNGSSMPAWDTLLSSDDIVAVVRYIKTLSPRFAAEQPEPIALSAPVPTTAESVTRGAAAYAVLQCSKCHGEDGRGTGATATSFDDDWGFPLHATNLGEPWTFRGGSAAADIFMRFRAGISGTPMPSYKGAATDAEMWDLANYVVTLRRKPVWEMNADEVTAFYKQQDAEALANPVKRGEYLTTTLGCPVCHSPLDSDKRMIPGMHFAGGLRMNLGPFGTYPTGNLTSDKETGLGNWTDDEIKRAITKGIVKDGSRLLPFPMDYASFSTMRELDLSAIVAFLRTVPPVKNKVPRPSRPLLPLYLWGKYQMLFGGVDLPSYFYAGNAGIASGVQR